MDPINKKSTSEFHEAGNQLNSSVEHEGVSQATNINPQTIAESVYNQYMLDCNGNGGSVKNTFIKVLTEDYSMPVPTMSQIATIADAKNELKTILENEINGTTPELTIKITECIRVALEEGISELEAFNRAFEEGIISNDCLKLVSRALDEVEQEYGISSLLFTSAAMDKEEIKPRLEDFTEELNINSSIVEAVYDGIEQTHIKLLQEPSWRENLEKILNIGLEHKQSTSRNDYKSSYKVKLTNVEDFNGAVEKAYQGAVNKLIENKSARGLPLPEFKETTKIITESAHHYYNEGYNKMKDEEKRSSLKLLDNLAGVDLTPFSVNGGQLFFMVDVTADTPKINYKLSKHAGCQGVHNRILSYGIDKINEEIKEANKHINENDKVRRRPLIKNPEFHSIIIIPDLVIDTIPQPVATSTKTDSELKKQEVQLNPLCIAMSTGLMVIAKMKPEERPAEVIVSELLYASLILQAPCPTWDGSKINTGINYNKVGNSSKNTEKPRIRSAVLGNGSETTEPVVSSSERISTEEKGGEDSVDTQKTRLSRPVLRKGSPATRRPANR